MINYLNLKRNTENGQGLVEYALILVLVAVVVIAILAVMGPSIQGIFVDAVAGIECGKEFGQPPDYSPRSGEKWTYVKGSSGGGRTACAIKDSEGETWLFSYGIDTNVPPSILQPPNHE